MATMRLRACWYATLWLILPAAMQAQAPAPNSVAAFAGTVRDSVTGLPIANAAIRLKPLASKLAYAGTTGPSGEFRFESVAPGDYRITVSRVGYVDAHSAVLKGGGGSSTLSFATGQNVTGAEVRLDPHGLITGRVTSSEGEPLADAQVHAYSEQWQHGLRTYQIQSGASTDDRGEYRLSVEPGRHYIGSAPAFSSIVPYLTAEAPGKPEMRTIALFYPAAKAVNESTALDVRPGQQITGIDFKLPDLATYHVRGVVKPYPPETVMDYAILRDRGVNVNGAGVGGPTKKDGSFDIPGVLPGNYWLELFPPGPRPSGGVAISVSRRDLNGITVPGIMPFPLTGHARLEDGSSPPAGFSLQLERLDWYRFNPSARFSLNPDGSFTFQNVVSGEWVLTAPPTGAFYIQSISYNQREAANGKLDLTAGTTGGLDVVLGTGTGEIDGSVKWPDAATGGTAPPYAGELAAVLVSQTGVTGNTGARSADIDQSGKFQFEFVPPGRYFVFVTAGFEVDLWQNREFVDLVAGRGAPVELAQKGSTRTTAEILPVDDIRRAIDRLPR